MLDADEAIDRMAEAAMRAGVSVRIPMVRGNALVHRVRNFAGMKRIRPDADFVLFCDDDMAPEPDALLRLLAHDAPVVSGLCTSRDKFPPELVAKAYNPESETFHPIERVKPDVLLCGQFGVGAAFLLIKKTVLDRALDWHLSGYDWVAENRFAHDRMCVPANRVERERVRIEGLRRALYESEGSHWLFHYSMQDNCLERGEDLHFSWALIKQGVEVAIDTGVWVQHIGHFPYGPHLFGIERWQDVKVEEEAA